MDYMVSFDDNNILYVRAQDWRWVFRSLSGLAAQRYALDQLGDVRNAVLFAWCLSGGGDLGCAVVVTLPPWFLQRSVFCQPFCPATYSPTALGDVYRGSRQGRDFVGGVADVGAEHG